MLFGRIFIDYEEITKSVTKIERFLNILRNNFKKYLIFDIKKSIRLTTKYFIRVKSCFFYKLRYKFR
jgi:hypothetical protein